MKLRFFYCKHCGKVIAIVKETNLPTICCGEEMEELIPGQVDASLEKHVPEITVAGCKVTVKVGSQPHPSTKDHYIEWILLKTDKGFQQKSLNPGDIPEADFFLTPGEHVQSAYAYCNLHKLWRAYYV